MRVVSSKMSTASGSAKTIEELFEDHHRAVLQSAFRITGNADDAQDVLQTVFMRLMHRSRPPDLKDGARAYFHRAAVNAALDIVRSRKASKVVSIDQVGPVRDHRPGEQPERIRSSKELAARLREAIGRLRPRSAEMFVLRFLEGYNNQEIAELMGTSPGTIAVTLHRTRSRLQEEVASFMGGI